MIGKTPHLQMNKERDSRDKHNSKQHFYCRIFFYKNQIYIDLRSNLETIPKTEFSKRPENAIRD